MRILIVDDDYTSRRIMQRMLGPLGEVFVAVDGEEAVRAFAAAWQDQEPFDLILMDILMPRLDGIEALKRIRSVESKLGAGDNERVKVLMVSSQAERDIVMQSLDVGADWYLVKPIDKAKLMEELGRLDLLVAEPALSE